jgi:Flp pilus assembly protein TadG
MMACLSALRSTRGAAAAEMALVTPLLLTIIIGSVELGSYFYNEHILVKAVRDGARYAARQNFSYYEDGSGNCASPSDSTMIGNVQALVRTSLLANGSDRFADIQNGDITVTAICETTATDLSSSTENMTGIYRGRTDGAPVVTVSATVDYAPVIGAPFGFSGAGLKLNATEEAAVMGI